MVRHEVKTAAAFSLKSYQAFAAVALVVCIWCLPAALPSIAFADSGDLAPTMIAQAQSDGAGVSVYRLYNPNNGDHHYTTGPAERDWLSRLGWTYEGVAWCVPSTPSRPVYRMYNPNSGDHHYTLGADERDWLVKLGWNYEGIAWYSTDASGAPVYRLFNKWLTAGTHHYTTSEWERDWLASLGWSYEGVAWYGVGSTETDLSGDYNIMGASQTSVAQMVKRYNAVGKPYPSGVYAQYGASTVDQFCQILYDEAAAEGVRAEVVFAQAMHETGWLQFGGDVRAEQCNFAGIGATGGVPGNSFNDAGAGSVRKGLRAQVQHLKAYASTEPLNNATVDPRFSLVTRGSAPTIRGLSSKWAANSSYGDALLGQVQSLLNS